MFEISCKDLFELNGYSKFYTEDIIVFCFIICFAKDDNGFQRNLVLNC